MPTDPVFAHPEPDPFAEAMERARSDEDDLASAVRPEPITRPCTCTACSRGAFSLCLKAKHLDSTAPATTEMTLAVALAHVAHQKRVIRGLRESITDVRQAHEKVAEQLVKLELELGRLVQS